MGSNQESLPKPESAVSKIEQYREAIVNFDKQHTIESLNEVSIALKRVLELDDNAEVYLESEHKTITGIITCADHRGKPLDIEILIDDLNGSLVVGRLKVRIEENMLQQKFDRKGERRVTSAIEPSSNCWP